MNNNQLKQDNEIKKLTKFSYTTPGGQYITTFNLNDKHPLEAWEKIDELVDAINDLKNRISYLEETHD